MAVETIIVTNSDATTDVTFSKIFESGFKSKFAMTGLSPSGARTIEVNHEMQPSNRLVGNDRHTVSLTRNVPVTINGLAGIAQASAQLVLSLPRNSEWTLALTEDLVKNLQCLLANSFVSGLYSGATLSGDYHVDSLVPA